LGEMRQSVENDIKIRKNSLSETFFKFLTK